MIFKALSILYVSKDRRCDMNQIDERIDVEEMRKLAATLGRKGGRSTSPAKREASAANLEKARAARKKKSK